MNRALFFWLLFLSVSAGQASAGRISSSFSPDVEPERQASSDLVVVRAPLSYDSVRTSYYFDKPPSFNAAAVVAQSHFLSHPTRKDDTVVSYQLSSPSDNVLLVPNDPHFPRTSLGFPLLTATLSGIGAYALQLPVLPYSLGGLTVGGGALFMYKRIYSPVSCAGAENLLTNGDRRQRVQDAIVTTWPWRVHGQLELEYSDSGRTLIYIGTGTLVGDRHVLTAGHNLFDHRKTKNRVKAVRFFPAKAGTNHPWEATGTEIIIHPRYEGARTPDEQFEYDIGMVKLDKPLGRTLGYFGLKTLDDGEMPKVTISGYPGNPDGGKYMYQMQGPITQHTSNRTLYDIDTTGGQSGSGVWTEGNDCVAVHTSGSNPYNGGTRLNTSYSSMIREWLK